MELKEILQTSETINELIKWQIAELRQMKVGTSKNIDGRTYTRIDIYRWSFKTETGKELILAIGSQNKITII